MDDIIEEIRVGLARPGKSKKGLAAALGRQPSAVTALLKGDREIKARELDVIRAYLRETGNIDGPPGFAEPPGPFIAPPAVQEVIPGPDVERDQHGPAIPVLGISAGGQESIGGREPDFMLNGDVVNYVARPKGLANANNVFSVYVTGDSMYPRYRERDLVILQKAAPAIGDDVVIELYPLSEGGEHPSFIKEFVARRGSYIVVKQFNPPKEIEFNMKEIRNIFRVIPTKEWVG